MKATIRIGINPPVDRVTKRPYNRYIQTQKELKMKDSTAMFLVVAGLVLTLAGAGGIETSMDNVGLAQGLLVAVVGLMTMAAGVLAIRVNSSTDYYK
jgi:hypothetical protein